MLRVITGIFLLCPFSIGQHFGDEAIYTINGKKALHHVSEKFLSISIDPAILLTGLNLSNTSLQLAKHLAPAYIRIAGPSTQFVKYEDIPSSEQENVVVTPAMWFGINEWLHSANLTPVFGINDGETTDGEWNPQTTMPLLDISDKFNLSCYWQLGYDCSNKTDDQYKSDLKRFHHVLEAFPDQKHSWKIVGSDLSRCISNNFTETSRRMLEDLEGDIAAIVWEPTTNSETCFLEEHLPQRLLSFPIKPKVPIWTASPKTPHPASFSSAISWAEQLGQAAKIGYEVIFRQPRLHEIFSESPPFWVSFLHKALMGRTVLEVKPTNGLNPPVSVYAHCSRHQNNFIRSGAMTVFMVNNSTKNHTIFLRFGVVLLSNIEVQSYILTAPSEDDTDVFLNGEKLSLNNFTGDKMNILPKLRRAKVMNYLSLSLPPKSIGFFVLPAAKVPVCVSEENDVESIMEEISEDQKISFADEVSVEIAPRFFSKKAPTLRELRNQMERELESDRKYYEEMKHKPWKANSKDTKRISFFTPRPEHHSQDAERRTIFAERLAHHADDSRLTHHHSDDSRLTHHSDDSERIRNIINDRLKQRQEPQPKKVFELELTSAEIKKVLFDRAKTKAAKKNIIFTSEELEEIMDKATEKILKNKHASIRVKKKEKREAVRDKKDINMRLLKLKSLGEKRRLMLKQMAHHPKIHKNEGQTRQKRDINMDLLKLKTELHKHKKSTKSRFHNKEEKEATIREDGDISADFADFAEEKEESLLPDEDVFAQIAPPDVFTPTKAPLFANLKMKTKPGWINIHKNPKMDFQSPLPKFIDISEEKPDTIDDADEDYESYGDSIGDKNFACIHEYSLSNIQKTDQTKKVVELWEAEAGKESAEEKKENHLPSLADHAVTDQKGEDRFGATSNISNFEAYFDEKKDELDSMGLDDYGDLESDESNPVRLKRSAFDQNLATQQYKRLKERLANRKKMKLVNKRRTRSIGESPNSYNKRYKSLTENLKTWKPSDILSLKNLIWKKYKRSVDTNLNSVENDIENFMNEITKDSKFMEPKLDMENGDYQLVFPNKDKIEVVENLGDTELKLLIHGNKDEEALTSTGKSVESNIQKMPKQYDNNVWQELFKKVTKFFQRLSVKLKNYVLKDLLK